MKHNFLHFFIAIVGLCCLVFPQIYMDLIGLALISNYAIRAVSYHCSEKYFQGISFGRSSTKAYVRGKLEGILDTLESNDAVQAQLAIQKLIDRLQEKDPQ